MMLAEDDYDCVVLSMGDLDKINHWYGTNVSLTSMVMTEMTRIRKTFDKGPREALYLAFPTIDAMTGGLCRGELLYIGGVEEKISAAFGLNIVKSFGIDQNQKLLVINAGRGEYAFARGLISLCSGFAEYSLWNGRTLTQDAIIFLEENMNLPQLEDISMINTPYISVESICEEVLKLKEEEQPALIIIDNLRFISTRKSCKSRYQEYRYISHRLWKLAKQTCIPTIVLGPMSKCRVNRKDYWPTALDMPAENMLDSFDKILMVHKGEPSQDGILLHVSSIKNPNSWYGYRNLRYLPDCSGLEEIITVP